MPGPGTNTTGSSRLSRSWLLARPSERLRRWTGRAAAELALAAAALAAAAAGLVLAAAPPEVCVIAPRIEPQDDGSAAGLLPLPEPTLVVAEPLQEVRLLAAERILWQRRLPEGQALPQPLVWPLPPLQGGEALTLLLRPSGQKPGHFAQVQLQAASAAELASHGTLVRRLGRDGQAWLAAIDQQLLAGQVSLAWALLFSPEAPADAELENLRREVIQRGCGD